MAKELPYFKFEPNEWINGNIQMASPLEKAYFIELCCLYWSRLGDLPIEFALRKGCEGNANALESLKNLGVFDTDSGRLTIKFLDIQMAEFFAKSEKNSQIAKGRWAEIKRLKDLADANALQTQSEGSTNRIEENRIEENKENIYPVFNFKAELLKLCPNKNAVEDWLKVRKKKKATNTEIALQGFLREQQKSELSVEQAIIMCVEKSWSGFNAEWVSNQKNPLGMQTQKSVDGKIFIPAFNIHISPIERAAWQKNWVGRLVTSGIDLNNTTELTSWLISNDRSTSDIGLMKEYLQTFKEYFNVQT
jgi:hypothetical protein